VMPPFTPVLWCSSHQSIILSYARDASSSWSKHPSDVGFPFRLRRQIGCQQKQAISQPIQASSGGRGGLFNFSWCMVGMSNRTISPHIAGGSYFHEMRDDECMCR
jgi:hypothetical protein